MEKGLEFGLEHYMKQIPGMEEADPKLSSPLVLAYIGDCVFDLIIKMRVAGGGNRQVHKLHEETSRYVQASAQSFMMRAMQEHLTAEEHAVYRRGRNARSVSPAKNQSITDYRRATGFEALLGYLYLNHEYERLTELVTIGLTSMESPRTNEERPDEERLQEKDSREGQKERDSRTKDSREGQKERDSQDAGRA